MSKSMRYPVLELFKEAPQVALVRPGQSKGPSNSVNGSLPVKFRATLTTTTIAKCTDDVSVGACPKPKG